jgi:hypothetical protein
MLRVASVADSRWSERCDHHAITEDKEVHWEHKYGPTTVPLHGEPGVGATWRPCTGSFCGNRQVQILIYDFYSSQKIIILRNTAMWQLNANITASVVWVGSSIQGAIRKFLD